ncbi:hypothetical protein TCAL_04584 [Tigriopus californicus]|uniref:Receptor protein-tyrosine kinase n=1 Tax=Tigriopus californicus TaxID=6832 RepID=A0A553PD85_TIGCA|nr:putative inactive tyrosine-protein kinase Wsck isoform X2 [Tigriopus californicus]TRY75642.1 hypothetical protein TCAL_04584 [Tigriopus californicus]|eukprot:TCALIF_04584-PA protein Name:"Similar to Wsck Putative tyrosine-protein kinase Wsck (Drosophila melanogaster)" AED:0.05 eAED:0.05 QI:111/1/0.91/1/0.81/0.91/12/37/807
MLLQIAVGFLYVAGVRAQFDTSIHRQYINCFKFENTDDPDFQIEITNLTSVGSIESCVLACQNQFSMYAGLHDGGRCFCGSSYGRFGPGDCKSRCTQTPSDICGGESAISVYSTDVKVPGPPGSLELVETEMTSLGIRWEPAKTPEDFVTDYHVFVEMLRSFDHKNQKFTSKHLQLSKTATGTRIVGLRPAALYNVSVSAASEHGLGPVISESFWTEIAAPDKPNTPELVSHHGQEHEVEDDNEIHIRFQALTNNVGGPITAYRIVVINETEPAPFYEENLDTWEKAQELGLKYWIAAEISPDWFDTHEEFVVGDQRFYGEYENHGPLPSKYDFHVTVGAVSSFNNVTKITYADVSHDQHADHNIVVFEFHEHNLNHDDESHGHDHGNLRKHSPSPPAIKDNLSSRIVKDTNHNPDHDAEGLDNLTVGLLICIGVCSVILLGIISLYGYLRWTVNRSSGSNGDAQELTLHTPSPSNHEHGGYELGIENEGASGLSGLDLLRESVWQIPRNFLELTHEVVGRGRFGSVIKGIVNSGEGQEAAIVQVVPEKILEKSETKAMIRDIEMVAKYGKHPNIMSLIGLCEERDAIYVVIEEGIMTFKQVLLDNRALVHNPVYVQRNRRISTLDESTLIRYLVEIAQGLERLEMEKIVHRKLCARNIMICNDIAKVGGVGITDYCQPGQDIDMARWRAQENFKSRALSSKSDVWSFGVIMWEAVTLGGTPYPDVKTKDLPTRISRGKRPPQTTNPSESLYQLMLECWQHDLDERPHFTSIVHSLQDLAINPQDHINFGVRPGFEYEHFSNDLELL